MMGFLKTRRRARLRSLPFPPEWRRIVEVNVPFFGRLPVDDQQELLGHVHVLLAEKHFEGCGGLELTDEIRVTIAAHASVLLLRRPTDYFPRLTSILVYPTAYVAPETRILAGGIQQEGGDVRLGHTGLRLGAVVISWEDTVRSARSPNDGHNVVLHEFAHLLDFEDSWQDGTPLLETKSDYVSWVETLKPAYESLRTAAAEGSPTFLDQYGAENPAEFFAVLTEFFFERSRELRENHPLVYRELSAFYKQDPASWREARSIDGEGR